MMKRSRNIDMLSGPLAKNIILYAIPVMVTIIVQQLFNSADTFIVGRFASSYSMAAVSASAPLCATMVSVFGGMGVGVNIVTARQFGRGDFERVHRCTHTAVCLGLLMGAFVCLLGQIFSVRLLGMMNTDPGIMTLAATYLRIYFLAIPFSLLYNMCASVLRALGDTQRPMKIIMLAGVVNVLLNIVFVALLHWDVAGVAIATVISNMLSCTLVLRCLVNVDGPHKLHLRKIRIYGKDLKDIVWVGLPFGLNGSLSGIADVTIQSAVNFLGPAAMAANAAAATMTFMGGHAMSAFHDTAGPFVSQNMGAKQPERIRRSIFLCALYAIATGLFFAIPFYLFGRPLLSMFVPADDPNLDTILSVGMVRLLIVGLPFFLCGVMDVFSSSLRGLGMSWTPFLVSLIGTCGLRILWINFIFYANPTPVTLYLCYPAAWIVTLSVLTGFLIWRLRSVCKQEVSS
jgi:Na+-driven multidrug efflux pump